MGRAAARVFHHDPGVVQVGRQRLGVGVGGHVHLEPAALELDATGLDVVGDAAQHARGGLGDAVEPRPVDQQGG